MKHLRTVNNLLLQSRVLSDKLVVESLPVNGNEAVVKLMGPLLLNTLSPFQDAMGQQTASVTLIDLTDVPYMDSAGLGSLVKSFVSCKRHGRRLALINPSEQVSSLMEMTKVETLFEIYSSVADAQRSLAAKA